MMLSPLCLLLWVVVTVLSDEQLLTISRGAANDVPRPYSEAVPEKDQVLAPWTRYHAARELAGLRAVEAAVRADAVEHALDGAVLMMGDFGVTVYDSQDHHDRGVPRPLPIREWLKARAAAIVSVPSTPGNGYVSNSKPWWAEPSTPEQPEGGDS